MAASRVELRKLDNFPVVASAVVTLRTYAHLLPGDEDRVRDVADAALSPHADSLRTEAAS